MEHAADSTAPAPDTGELRGDLLALLAQMADRLAGPFGEAVRGLMAEPLSDPQRTRDVRAALTGAGDRRLQQVVVRAAERGEAELDSLGPWAIGAAPALLSGHFLVHGTPIAEEVLAAMVDDAVLPLLRAGGGGRVGGVDPAGACPCGHQQTGTSGPGSRDASSSGSRGGSGPASGDRGRPAGTPTRGAAGGC